MSGWLGFFGAPPPKIPLGEILRRVPVRVPGVASEEGPNGERLLLLPRRSAIPVFLRRWIRDDPPPVRLLLDDPGGAVWGDLDGRRSIGELSARFAHARNVHPREAETAVIAFLGNLACRGAVALMPASYSGELVNSRTETAS